MARIEAQSLRQRIADGSGFLWDRAARVRIADLIGGTSFDGRLEQLAGRSVVIATGSQLTTALALIELDGVARRLTILPPDAEASHFAALFAGADADAVIVDRDTPENAAFELPIRVACSADIVAAERLPAATFATEWVLLTTGTIGVPKMVV